MPQPSPTQRLALLHAAIVLAMAYGGDFASSKTKFAGFLLSVIAGFLAIVFRLLPQELVGKRIQEQVSSPPPLLADFSLSVTDARTHQGKVEYRLDVTYRANQWTAWLRYSALLDLAGRIGKRGIFPPKSSLASAAMGSDRNFAFVDHRRRELDRFVRVAIPNREAFEILLNTQPELRAYLAVPSQVTISKDSGKADRGAIVKQALDILQQVQAIAAHSKTREGGDGWTYHSSSNGVDCFLKRDGNFTYSQGRGAIQSAPRRAVEFMLDFTHRKAWDDLFGSQVCVEEFRAYSFDDAAGEFGETGEWDLLALQIAHSQFTSPTSLVAARDSVCTSVVGRRKSDGALCIGLASVDDARVPEGKDGYVRAQVKVAGFLFEPRLDGQPGSVMTTMGLVDPNGNIPQFVVNVVAPKRAFIISDVDRACLKFTSS